MQVRTEFNDLTPEDAMDFIPFGRFNPQQAWDSTRNRDPVTVVNPLMSSMQCFNTSTYFPEGFEVQELANNV